MQKETPPPVQRGAAVKVIAVICCLVGMVGLGSFAFLLAKLGLGEGEGPPGSAGPWLIDVFLLLAFGIQHSVMARTAFKRTCMRSIPPSLQRSVYVAASGAVLVVLTFGWQPLEGAALWRLPYYGTIVALLGGAGLGVVIFTIDGLDLFGIRQAWHLENAGAQQLRIVGLYRWVRHPLMSCMLLLFWGWPVMAPTLALLSGGMTLYIFLSMPLEERTLIARFGRHYLDYRRRVPAYLPWRWPATAVIHDEVGQ